MPAQGHAVSPKPMACSMGLGPGMLTVMPEPHHDGVHLPKACTPVHGRAWLCPQHTRPMHWLVPSMMVGIYSGYIWNQRHSSAVCLKDKKPVKSVRPWSLSSLLNKQLEDCTCGLHGICMVHPSCCMMYAPTHQINETYQCIEHPHCSQSCGQSSC